MRSFHRWFLSVGVATTLLGAGLEHEASAQPVRRDHRQPKADPPPPAPAPPTPRDHRQPKADPPPPPPTDPLVRRRRPADDDRGPREAPPAAKAETHAARAGYVWAPGHWEWRADKWEWVAGHWERERAGKAWRSGRWEQKGDRWAFTQGAWIDAATAPPAASDRRRPREAPPSPREERQAARAGYVWVAGNWDWRGDKWEWIAGHLERERAGKAWSPARWELRDGFYVRVDGAWIDNAAPPAVRPPPTMTPPPPGRRDRRTWTIERPVISSYWPAKGKPGARIVIRGRNFPANAMVVWAGQPLRGAKVTANQIQFAVPQGATSGPISLRAGHGRDLAVGMFEVAAAFDAAAEQRRIEEERRKAAEAAWAARQRELAKDRAAREAAMNQRWAEQAATREQRRAARIAQLEAKWQRAFLASDEAQDELALHAQRIAEIDRLRDFAELRANGKLVVRIDMMHNREDDRHSQRMAALEASFRAGGTP